MAFDAVAAVFLTGFVFGVPVGALATRSCCRRGSSPRPPSAKTKDKPSAKESAKTKDKPLGDCQHKSVLRQVRQGLFEMRCTTCGFLIVREPLPVACEHISIDYRGTNQHGPRLRCMGQCKKVLLKNTRDEAVARHDD